LIARSEVTELVLLGDDGTARVTRSREGQEAVALLPLQPTDDVAGLLWWATTGARSRRAPAWRSRDRSTITSIVAA
jgi:hypothetical protein